MWNGKLYNTVDILYKLGIIRKYNTKHFQMLWISNWISLFFLDLSSRLAPVLPGSLDKGPLHGNRLPQYVILVQLLLGGEGLFICLVLDQGIALEKPCPPVQIEVNVLKHKRR